LFFFFVVALLNVVDSFNLNIVWPLLPFMVDSYGVARTEEDLGAWVGAAGAAVSVGQLLSSYAWGALSDRIGRRPVMLIGMCNSTFSVLVFGTARTYAQCLAGRFLSGLLNGNAGVVKTYVGETTEKSQQTVAFSIFAMAFGFASCVAPAIGGFLQRPAERWPSVFGDTLFETFPFLLPMLCAAALTSVGGVLGFLYAPETASQWRRMQKRSAERERRMKKKKHQTRRQKDVDAADGDFDGEALLRAAAEPESFGKKKPSVRRWSSCGSTRAASRRRSWRKRRRGEEPPRRRQRRWRVSPTPTPTPTTTTTTPTTRRVCFADP
jgi:diphthamide biosynthesis protein 2